MANSIGAFSANILARFNAAYSAGQGNTSQGASSQGASSAATSASDAIAKLKNAIGDASSPANAGNDAVILNLSAAAQQLLASLQGGAAQGGTGQSGTGQGGTGQGDAAQTGDTRSSLVQAINQQIANQPGLASYLATGQNTTINGLNFMNGFGTGGSDAAGGIASFGSGSDIGGAIEQFQQWLSQPLQANLERAIERQKESSPLNETKTGEKNGDKGKAPDQTASDTSTSSTTGSANAATDTAATGGTTADSGQAST
jgi:hypothetical protein